MKITDFPLGEIPYTAISLLTDDKEFRYGDRMLRLFDPYFEPSTMSEDLRFGKPTPLVYWYPHYIDGVVHSVAEYCNDPEEVLNAYHPDTAMWFKYFFPDIWKVLNGAYNNSIKSNHLNEVQIIKGKLKL